MARFSTYLFDLDGTLIDSIELIMSSFRHTMLTHRGAVPPDDEWRAGSAGPSGRSSPVMRGTRTRSRGWPPPTAPTTWRTTTGS